MFDFYILFVVEKMCFSLIGPLKVPASYSGTLSFQLFTRLPCLKCSLSDFHFEECEISRVDVLSKAKLPEIFMYFNYVLVGRLYQNTLRLLCSVWTITILWRELAEENESNFSSAFPKTMYPFCLMRRQCIVLSCVVVGLHFVSIKW